MGEQAPAGWHVDPFGRYERRYWEGSRWTEHVETGGLQGIDPAVDPPPLASAAAESVVAGWYPDPLCIAGRRYWDGERWTQHLDSGAEQAIQTDSTPHVGRPNKKIERQARKGGADGDHQGGGTLFTEQVLVINQKAKVLGSTVGYAVYNQNGQQLGTIEEIRRQIRSNVADGLRGRPDSKRMRRFRVVDMNHRALLAMTRPPVGWITTKAKLVVEGPEGAPIGQIAHESFGLGGSVATATHTGITNASVIAQVGLGGVRGMAAGMGLGSIQDRLNSAVEGLDKIGHARFGLEADGQRLGSIHAEDTSAWDFSVKDPTGTEIARITKTWAGWAKERFTKADNYVVLMHRPLDEPLRSLVIAAALAIDVELKERGKQTRGSSISGTRRYK